nr:MAG TPA: ASCH domain protein [Caudoviricetes sp.]
MEIKPILFNTEMVRAILDGRKTCTRRIVKDGIPDDAMWGYTAFTPKGYISCRGVYADGYGEGFYKLPYQPGDILYVRETWERFECWNCEGDERGNCPKEPKKSVLNKTCGCYMYRATDEISGDAKWHPSIHMPKEAARIWLKVTDVRVERLQEMTLKDFKAEGIYDDYKTYSETYTDNLRQMAYPKVFARLWNSTIPKSDLDRYGWSANPWVWIIEFERCEKPQEVNDND